MITIDNNITNFSAISNMLSALIDNVGEPDEIIHRDGEEYLRRWFIVRKYGKHNMYLHQFMADDHDDALHDHPWPSVSLILRGRYKEVMEDGEYIRRAGDIVFRNAETPHRIVLIDNEPVYTLFITGPKERHWGFHCEDGWKPWQDFEKDGGC